MSTHGTFGESVGMAELRIPCAHSNEWYDHLATIQNGHYYPWTSSLGARNGEGAFHDLVAEHLQPGMHVLEIDCGHGDLSLQLAGTAGKVTAYDRISPWIDRARHVAATQGVANIDYLCHDAANPAHDRVTLPVDDNSVDLFVCRRGPLHWIPDAERVAKPGAVIIHLSPMEEPIPAWTSKLPHKLHYENCGRYSGAGTIHMSVENHLQQAGLTLDSGRSFDVPERFDDARQLYKVVTWGPPRSEVEPLEGLAHRFERIFDTYAEDGSIVLRHCRYLWNAVIGA